MSDFDRRVSDLLEQAAGPAVAEQYDVDGLMAAATRLRQRRRQRSAIATAVFTAAVVLAVVLVPSLGVGSRGESPAAGGPAVSAATLAHGRWVGLPAAPFRLCSGVQTAWTGHELLVVQPGGADPQGHCSAAAATLDPATRRWQSIAPPPAGLRGTVVTVWTGTQLLVAEPADGSVVMWNRAGGRWTSGPALPPTAHGSPTLAMWRGQPVAVGVGPNGDGVLRLVDGHWRALPSLPLGDSTSVRDATAAEAGGDLYVNYTLGHAVPHNGYAEHAAAAVYHADRWSPVPWPNGGYPRQAAGLGKTHVWFAVRDCPADGSCAAGPGSGGGIRVLPDDGTYADPGGPAIRGFLVVSGYGAAAFNAYDYFANGVRTPAGQMNLYDPESQRWLTGPPAPAALQATGGGYALAWTPRALIVLADTASGSGLELVPASSKQ